MTWQLQDAKQHFSRVVQRALDEGPQVVTRHGAPAVVILSAEEYRRLTSDTPDFSAFLLTGPDFSALELERARDIARAIDL